MGLKKWAHYHSVSHDIADIAEILGGSVEMLVRLVSIDDVSPSISEG